VGNRVRAWRRIGARVVAVEPQPAFMRLLRRWYRSDPEVTLVGQAVGASPGQATLLISQRTPTVTTLSAEWTAAVRQARSFAGVEWDASLPVGVTTLDALIAQYGEPVFCKVDVEGYELEVLKGLSRPIRALSFEYIPATMEIARACVDRLCSLGAYAFNWTVGEGMRFQSEKWVGGEAMSAWLAALPTESRSGDVYARLV
jgi:FkbM family methyltransferase